ncbi:MAG: S-methyl-5-thioribose-1-phosphate isomerase [Dehalococcoidales bacterium]|nr:S-methyl-5-thioribose-1-phosphate isomerase [Dehalococcoidales bacterium]
MKENYQPVEWLGNKVKILDQTRLPQEEVYLELDDYQDIASAIRELKIRGAPAIGVAGGYAIALGSQKIQSTSKADFLAEFQQVSRTIAGTRPTARNLFMAVERMEQVAKAGKSVEESKKGLVEEAVRIHSEEAEATEKLSRFGAELIKDGFTILTHCNAGPLATTGYGTALGVIIRASEEGKKVKVFADETRPLLQGARLTTWELKKAGIPVTLITDSMAGYFISRGEIDCVIVGADRITANGDTANKIGTYTLAVLAKENGIPFYVAAPTTTIDHSLATGKEIPIEERKPEEVTHIQRSGIAPEGIEAQNPAFDVTPHKYITALITERGIIREPLGEGIKKIS